MKTEVQQYKKDHPLLHLQKMGWREQSKSLIQPKLGDNKNTKLQDYSIQKIELRRVKHL